MTDPDTSLSSAPPADEPVPPAPLVEVEKKTNRLERVAIGLLFALPVLLFIWPALTNFSSVVLGLDDDNVLNVWTFWHASNAFLLSDEPLYSTMRVLAPVGSSLVLHDMSILPILLLTPVTAIFGVFAGYNLLLVMAQLWAGFATYKLVHLLTRSRLGAAFGAFYIEMSPVLYYRMINHYSLTYLGFIPFLIYLLLKGADPADAASPRRRGLVTGAAAIACFLTSFNIFTLAFFTVGMVWLVMLASALAVKSFSTAKRMMWIVAWTGLVCAAFFYVWAVITPLQDARFWTDKVDGSYGNETCAQITHFVSPNPKIWAFARSFSWEPNVAGSNANPERFNNLGLTGLILFTLGMATLARRRLPVMIALLIATLLCFNLALGYGSINPAEVKNADQLASPFLLFPKFLSLPLMKNARVPARWVFPLLGLIATGAGCGCHWVLGKIQRPNRRLIALAGLCGFVFFEFCHTATPTTPFALPPAYRAMGQAQDPTEMVVEWPLYMFCGLKGVFGTCSDPERQIWAMQNNYRTAAGYLSRIPIERLALLINQPFLRDLWMLQEGNPGLLLDTEPTDPDAIRRWLFVNDVRFVVVRKTMDYQKVLKFVVGNQFADFFREDENFIVLKVTANL